MLFTDGESNDIRNPLRATVKAAYKLKNSRPMKLITVGVGVSSLIIHSCMLEMMLVFHTIM